MEQMIQSNGRRHSENAMWECNVLKVKKKKKKEREREREAEKRTSTLFSFNDRVSKKHSRFQPLDEGLSINRLVVSIVPRTSSIDFPDSTGSRMFLLCFHESARAARVNYALTLGRLFGFV